MLFEPGFALRSIRKDAAQRLPDQAPASCPNGAFHHSMGFQPYAGLRPRRDLVHRPELPVWDKMSRWAMICANGASYPSIGF